MLPIADKVALLVADMVAATCVATGGATKVLLYGGENV